MSSTLLLNSHLELGQLTNALHLSMSDSMPASAQRKILRSHLDPGRQQRSIPLRTVDTLPDHTTLWQYPSVQTNKHASQNSTDAQAMNTKAPIMPTTPHTATSTRPAALPMTPVLLAVPAPVGFAFLAVSLVCFSFPTDLQS